MRFTLRITIMGALLLVLVLTISIVEDGSLIIQECKSFNRGGVLRIEYRMKGTERIRTQSRRACGDVVIARPIDCVAVAGRSEPVLVSEPLCLRDEGDPECERISDLSERALSHYRNRSWNQAIQVYEEILRFRPEDLPAMTLMLRYRMYLSEPPGPEWDGVYRFATK